VRPAVETGVSAAGSGARALLADDEATVAVERHPVRDPRVGADDRDAVGLEGEAVAVERQALDRHRGPWGSMRGTVVR
jgi:hypothetical protein